MHSPTSTHICKLDAELSGILTLGLAPQHYGINQRFRFPVSYVTQRRYELVELGIHAGTTHQLDSGFGLSAIGHALSDFLVGLGDEGVEQVVKRILPNGLELAGWLA